MKYLLILLLGLFFLSCNGSKEFLANRHILIDQVIHTQTFEDLISDHKYVKLESGKDMYIKNIDKIVSRDHVFYILDASSSAIYKFDGTGKFLLKVGRQGRGYGEYQHIIDFDVDHEGNIYILDTGLQSVFQYKDNGQFVKQIKLEDIYAQNIVASARSGILLYQPNPILKQQDYNLFYYANGKLSGIGNQVEREAFGIDLLKPFALSHSHKGSVLFNQDLSNIIYNIDTSGNLHEAYYIDFGKKNIHQSLTKDKTFFRKRGVQNIEEGWRVHNFFETSKYFTVSYNYDKKSWFLMHSFDTKKTISTFCPNCDMNHNRFISQFKPIGVSENYFISELDYTTALNLRKMIAQYPKMKERYSNKTLRLLDSIDETSNPLLFLYKVKF